MAKKLPNVLDIRNTDGIIRPSKKRLAFLRKKWVWISLFAVLIMAAVTVATLYLLSRQEAEATTGVKAVRGMEKKISRHYILPTDETPALATVMNKEKLTTPLFKSSENGDKILIYQKNRMAIIYRPSKDRIVAVGPIVIDTPKNGIQPGDQSKK